MRTLRGMRDWLTDELDSLSRRANLAVLLGWAAFCLVLLLIMTLIQSGALQGWADLIRDVSPADA
jgi:hypothetical protein